MSLGTILLIILVLLLIGAFPGWGYSRSWGYGPSGILGFLLVVVLDPVPPRTDLTDTDDTRRRPSGRRRPVRPAGQRREGEDADEAKAKAEKYGWKPKCSAR